jgi:hypothetical protein
MLKEEFSNFELNSKQDFNSCKKLFTGDVNILCIILKGLSRFDIDYDIFEYNISNQRWFENNSLPFETKVTPCKGKDEKFIKFSFDKREMDENIKLILNEKDPISLKNIIVYYEENFKMSLKLPKTFLRDWYKFKTIHKYCTSNNLFFREVDEESLIWKPQEWFNFFTFDGGNIMFFVNVNEMSRSFGKFAIYNKNQFSTLGMIFRDELNFKILSLLLENKSWNDNLFETLDLFL